MWTTLPNSNLTLRDYQKEDVAFLVQKDAAACFNEPRTGKTPTAIHILLERGIDKSVIVVPASALYPWQLDFRKWTNMPATVVTGTPLQKHKIIENWEHGALIISYGSLKDSRTNLLDCILRKQPEASIIDEAHRIKQRKTANATAVFKLGKATPIRLALTGTPAPGKPIDIWSILHYLYPDIYTSYWEFAQNFCWVNTCTNSQGHRYYDIGQLKPNKVAELQSILNNLATMRKRKEVMPWLPEKEDPVQIFLPATKEQTKYLRELKDVFETEHIVTQTILDRLIRYRQICQHPKLLDLKGKSPKLEWLKDYLSDYPEKPTILFSNFTSFLHLISKEITTPHAMIIGATSAQDRAKAIDDFQSGKINLLLLNTVAGKENLTLDRAEVTIFADKFPPAGDVEQAEARFIATTEEKADIPKVIYELIIENTYDEKCYHLVSQRAAAVDAINNFKQYMKGE